MSPLKHSNNIAARMGRWSARHRKIAIFGWLAFVIVAFMAGNAAGVKNLEDSDTGNGESRSADEVIDAAGFRDRADEQVLVQSRDGKLRASAPAFTSAVRDVKRRLRAESAIERIESPLAKDNAGQISDDGRSAIITFEIKGDPEKADEKIASAAKSRSASGIRTMWFLAPASAWTRFPLAAARA